MIFLFVVYQNQSIVVIFFIFNFVDQSITKKSICQVIFKRFMHKEFFFEKTTTLELQYVSMMYSCHGFNFIEELINIFCNAVEHIGVITTSSPFSSTPYKHLKTSKFKIHLGLQGMCQIVHSLNDMFNTINIKVWAYESNKD